MNGKALLAGLLALALVVPGAFADDPPEPGHEMSREATVLSIPFPTNWFLPDPSYPEPYDPKAQLDIYGAKHMNPTAYPPLMFGIRLYDWGAYTPRPTFLGVKNPIMSGLMIFGDLRLAAVDGTLGGVPGSQKKLAARLNLEGDWQFTPTERIHALVRPLDTGGIATNYRFGSNVSGDKFTHEGNFGLKTFFFEGDLGQIVGGITDKDMSWDRPIGFGRLPIFTQNGIWTDNAIDGASMGIFTAKSSRKLDIPNYDLIVFAGFHNIGSPALPKGDTSARIAGLAGFFDGFGGYTEYGYGYFQDPDNPDLSYHNVTAAYSKRWWGKFANSYRVIGNFGQKANGAAKTADGVLLLFESSLVRGSLTTINTLTFVPYLNLFAGFKKPQPLARAADTGGVLKNTGINFETDGMTAYPTLTASANDAYGGALGLEYLFQLDQQIVGEVARYQPRGDNNPLGAQTAVGLRFQRPITHTWIVRADAMKGWRTGLNDIYGVRLEFRRKF
jgi:hypothetical protein